MRRKTFSIASVSAAALAFAVLGLAGCFKDSHEDHDDDHHPWEHACMHAGDTPMHVTANADTAMAHAVSIGHTPYNVSFAAGSKVKFTVTEHGEFGIFLTDSVPVTLSTASGTPVPFYKTVSPLEGCAALAVMHVTPHLEEGTFHLTFGESSAASVGLLIEELEDDDH
jgi:hypothetical protein